MKRHLIYCGLNSIHVDQYGHIATYEGRRRSPEQLVSLLAKEHFPNGHTIHSATGRCMDGGVLTDEPTLIVEVWEVAGFPSPPIGEFAGSYKELAQQFSVVILTVPCDAVVI